MELKNDLKYLQLLSQSYPSISKASTEIINLKAILNLPKGTDQFLSDIHGEFDAFDHILRSGSGLIKEKIDQIFPDYSKEDRALLATIIYYPRQKIDNLNKLGKVNNEFYHKVLVDLIAVAKVITSKHTRSNIRKRTPEEFTYIIEELLMTSEYSHNKEAYYHEIIDAIIETGRAIDFIDEMGHLIQRFAIDRLHILGDIYDRGNGAFRIVELLKTMPSVDITFGNHDVVYMGAAAGNACCAANVIRTSCRYNTLSTIEEGYGISLRPLVTFALKYYADDPCTEFIPSLEEAKDREDYDNKVIAKMHKAITIIQFKLEHDLVLRHPNYHADHLLKLGKIDFETNEYVFNGTRYPLIDSLFPTIDPKNPYQLTEAEEELVTKLTTAFRHCRKLQEHVNFFFQNGTMYVLNNDNLLYHGCIPTNPNGSFIQFTSDEGETYSGKEYLDYCDQEIRFAYYGNKHDPKKQVATDFFYYLWCCPNSPLYGKSDITTFERYFLNETDRKNFPESKNAYYTLMNEEGYCKEILKEFGLDPELGVIINGHMPVKIKKGESPIKSNGKLIIIDGGICKAYQKVTGIAGYTLVYNSYGMKLIAHDVFPGKDIAVKENMDILHSSTFLNQRKERIMVKETYEGRKLQAKIDELTELLYCYRTGLIKAK